MADEPKPIELAWPEALKDALIMAFVRRAGGIVDIPVKELEDHPDERLVFRLDIPAAPTGEIKVDARIGGSFHFELWKKP